MGFPSRSWKATTCARWPSSTPVWRSRRRRLWRAARFQSPVATLAACRCGALISPQSFLGHSTVGFDTCSRAGKRVQARLQAGALDYAHPGPALPHSFRSQLLTFRCCHPEACRRAGVPPAARGILPARRGWLGRRRGAGPVRRFAPQGRRLAAAGETPALLCARNDTPIPLELLSAGGGT